MNWRPISELPELEADGFSKPVLLFMEDYSAVGFWTQRGHWMVRGMKIVEPTHWCEITQPSEATDDIAALRRDAKLWEQLNWLVQDGELSIHGKHGEKLSNFESVVAAAAVDALPDPVN